MCLASQPEKTADSPHGVLGLTGSEEIRNMGSKGRVQFSEVDLIENMTFERGWPEYLSGNSRDKRLEPGCVRERRQGEASRNTRALGPAGSGYRPGVFSEQYPACDPLEVWFPSKMQ